MITYSNHICKVVLALMLINLWVAEVPFQVFKYTVYFNVATIILKTSRVQVTKNCDLRVVFFLIIHTGRCQL